MAEDNPFADPANINPFADPSVTTATSTAPPQDDYNPFADQQPAAEPEPIKLPPPPTKAEIKAKEKEKKKEKKKEKEKEKAKPKATNQFSEPAIMEPDEPPEYTPAPSSFEDERLKKKEEEIARREAALHEREQNIERLGPGESPKNFPPFPKFCPSPFKPCFYISIKNEVHPTQQWKMYLLLALMIYLWVLLVINLIVAIAGAITATSVGLENINWYLTTMGIAIVYLILFCPGAFFCWFLPAYYAFRKDSSLAFMWFFFAMAFQVLSFVLGAIGPPTLGACGWYLGGVLFQSKSDSSPTGGQVAVGAMYIILGCLWLLGAIPAVILIIVVHKHFRNSGGSVDRAINEGVTGAAKNKAVRGALKSTVKAGVKTAMSADDK